MAKTPTPRRVRRPVLLAIAGDSAAGKTTLTDGLAEALGKDRCVSICVDDYHRYDRQERKCLPFTALHPDCNYVEIMEQHLQLLATGRPILKPVYDHGTGLLARPELIEPAEFIIVEGLLPLHTKLARTCFDVTVYLDPPEDVRRRWKINRDTGKRGYAVEQVTAEMERRRPESDAFIIPQRRHADIVVRIPPDHWPRRPTGHAAVSGAAAATHHPPSRPDHGARAGDAADYPPHPPARRTRPTGGRPVRARRHTAGGKSQGGERDLVLTCRRARRCA